ncbi:FAD-dependent oxidoreductase [Gordonia sp. VNQ95]|uniref:FAD-dependent oxidoreductase n=1 Tax=Gordonia sp. VNQ95 TaxID=3156619 RepID=UPI0032B626F1
MTTERIVVIGADAAGMSAAHQALRSARAAGRDIEVIALERTQDTSYSACGIPYLVAGLVGSEDELSARSPEQHRAMGVDLRMGVTAERIDLTARQVDISIGDALTGESHPDSIGFDTLVLATGAQPIIPDWARDADGELLPGVQAAKTLDDARYWLDLLGPTAAGEGRRGLVVGGGYIGIEMAEALLERGCATTLITRSTVMSSLDPEMSDRIADTLREAGVELVTGDIIASAELLTDGTKRLTTRDGRTLDADVVMLGLGVRPATTLGAEAGLPVGEFGGYRTDDHQYLGHGVWAAGDCSEVTDRMTGRPAFLPLGTHANKQGRVCGYNIVGGNERFAGALGTAITRFRAGSAYLEIARTGLSTRHAAAAGFDPVSLITDSSTASGYMNESSPIAIDIIADRHNGRLLGGQIVGGQASGKRIDTIAAALWGAMSVDDLAEMDLAYAPPFATVWEAVQLAARRLAERL